jgi:peptidoglycan/LPS O-acetylase OafA/YrhL
MGGGVTEGSRPVRSGRTDSGHEVEAQSSRAGSAARSPGSPRDYRLDVLRGLAIFLVMLWHTRPLADFGQLPVLLPAYFFNFEIALTAVPVLFTVSLMLLMQRTSRGLTYLRRRLQRLLIVLAACFAVQVLVYVAALQSGPPTV